MQFRSIACAILVCSSLCPSIRVASAQQPTPPEGFTALFNGKDLSGWYGWSTRDPKELWDMSAEEQAKTKRQSIEGGAVDKNGKPTDDHINAHWRVENGELVNDGHGLYLTTDKDYGDFELMVEYKALPKGDSGVYLRGTPQVQIWDPNEPDPSGLGRALGSGGLWNNRKGSPGKDPLKKMDKPLGEWNSLHIKMIGELTTVKLNGEVVVDNAPLENFFANQKNGYIAYVKPDGTKDKNAEKLPNGFMLDPVYAKGPIQLQTHGSEIRWRNVYLREIGPDEANRTLAARDAEGFVELNNGQDLSNWTGLSTTITFKMAQSCASKAKAVHCSHRNRTKTSSCVLSSSCHLLATMASRFAHHLAVIRQPTALRFRSLTTTVTTPNIPTPI